MCIEVTNLHLQPVFNIFVQHNINYRSYLKHFNKTTPRLKSPLYNGAVRHSQISLMHDSSSKAPFPEENSVRTSNVNSQLAFGHNERMKSTGKNS